MCSKMIIVIFIGLILSQSSASFFGELSGALSTVKSSVGTLLADVGHDLKETYDCTVDAVELMIYDKDQISKYYDKCKGTSTESNPMTLEKIDTPKAINIYLPPFVPVTPKTEVTTKLDSIIIEKYSRDGINIDQKLDIVEKVLNNETYRVDNMSNHLELEFGDLAKNVNKELNIIEEDKRDLQKILLEIEKLQWEREMHIDKTKDEIRGVFDEILKKINNSTKETNFKNEIKAIVGDVETNSSKTILEELEKWKEKEIELLKDIKAEEDIKQRTSQSNIPRTFKEVAAKISKESLTTNNPTTGIVNSTKPVTTNPNEIITLTSSELSTKVSTLTNTVTSTEAATKDFSLTSTVTPTGSTTLVPISTATLKGSTTQPSTSTTNVTTTQKPILTSSATITVISTAPSTQAPSTTKLTTQIPSTTPTITSTEITTQALSTSTIATTRKQTIQILNPTTTITTQPTSQTTITTSATIPTEPTKGAPITTSATIPTEPTTGAPITTTTVTTTQASSLRTTVTTIEPTTEVPSTTTTTTEPTTTTTRKHKRHKKPKRPLRPILTTVKPIIKVTTNPSPSEDYGGLIQNDVKSAAEEALSIFNKSMKTKAILDKFFKNL